MKYRYEVRNAVGNLIATTRSLRSAKQTKGADAIRQIPLYSPIGDWTVSYTKSMLGSGRHTKDGYQWLKYSRVK